MEIKNRMTAVTGPSMNDTAWGSATEGAERVRQEQLLAGETGPTGTARETLRVRDVMTREVKSCRPQDTLAAAALAMNGADCRFLPVVDPAGRPIGVITDGDVCLLGANEKRPLREISVHEVMNQPVTTCGPDTDILDVLRMMQSERIRHVPVIGTDGVLVGIVSLTDVVLCAEERGDRFDDPVSHGIVAALREIAQKDLGSRCVRKFSFIED
jgi:CBS domain-containing protein